uniref:Uncharacterized protein n=1 Tax=Lotharella globosa TaxID=91324 RepID=A0A7S3Z7H2_9EUKA
MGRMATMVSRCRMDTAQLLLLRWTVGRHVLVPYPELTPKKASRVYEHLKEIGLDPSLNNAHVLRDTDLPRSKTGLKVLWARRLTHLIKTHAKKLAADSYSKDWKALGPMDLTRVLRIIGCRNPERVESFLLGLGMTSNFENVSLLEPEDVEEAETGLRPLEARALVTSLREYAKHFETMK